jgi:hypothetical protein
MPLHIAAQTGVPLPDDYDSQEPKSVKARAKVAVKTAEVLIEAGADIPVSDQAKDAAVDMFQFITDSESKTEAPAAAAASATLTTPASVIHLAALLRDYDHQLVDDAVQLRRFVTNKLIEETNKENASNRIKALELLGKISDVGLFSEKTEITVKNASVEDLQGQIRNKLLKIIGKSKVIDGSFEVIEKEMGTLTPEDFKPND